MHAMVQALVEHFSANGHPEAVERAVLHMDIASLDLNQVRSLLFHKATISPEAPFTIAVSITTNTSSSNMQHNA